MESNNTPNSNDKVESEKGAYSSYNQQPTQMAYQVEADKKEEPVSLLNWLGTIFIYTIPCVGFIVYLIWAFDKNTNKNKSNFCKAMLVYSLLITVIVGFLYIFVFALVFANIGSMAEMVY